jgi:glutamyl-tRNA reductase
MIIGEGEILGQVREAWTTAEREGAVGQMLSRTFRHAVEVGKRARTETGISRHAVSVSSAAVQVAGERLGSLEGRRVLLLGAGDVGEGMAMALSGAGVGEIVVANRSRARGRELAARVGGRAVPLDDVLDMLVSSDVLLASTGAPGTLLERADMEEVMRRRDGRALLIVDVAVPRDVDPGVANVFGVMLLDIDDLKAVGEQSLQHRRAEVGKVRVIITDEIERLRMERLAREVAPLVTSLRERAEELRQTELDRHSSKLAALDPTTREMVDQITRALMNKVLHEPTVRLKDAAGSARGELYADALAALFALDDLTPDDLTPDAEG